MSRKRAAVQYHLGSLFECFTEEFRRLDENAALCINERDIFELMVLDAIGQLDREDRKQQEYYTFINDMLSFDMGNTEICDILLKYSKILRKKLRSLRRVIRTDVEVKWRSGSASVILVEKEYA